MYLTEEEILLRQKEQLFGLQKLFRNKDLDFDDFCSLIPGAVHLNKVYTLEIMYLDKRSRENWEVHKEEVRKNGKQVLLNHIEPHSYQQVLRLFSTIDFEDSTQVVSYFQLLNGVPPKPKEYNWFYSVKKRFNEDLTISVTNSIHSLGNAHQQLAKVLEENLFLRKNLSKMESLSRREKEILKLVSQGNNSKEIAEKLFISPHTVRTHRKNIWNKLEINNYTELIRFAEQFDLIK